MTVAGLTNNKRYSLYAFFPFIHPRSIGPNSACGRFRLHGNFRSTVLLGFFTLRGCDTTLDPFKDLTLMVEKHLTQSGFGRANEPAITLGWSLPTFDVVVPYTVGVGDIDE
jgi:hypothetical protein